MTKALAGVWMTNRSRATAMSEMANMMAATAICQGAPACQAATAAMTIPIMTIV